MYRSESFTLMNPFPPVRMHQLEKRAFESWKLTYLECMRASYPGLHSWNLRSDGRLLLMDPAGRVPGGQGLEYESVHISDHFTLFSSQDNLGY